MALYRDFCSQSEIDHQYNAGGSVPDYLDWMHWYQRESESYRRETTHQVLRYGATLDESLELYPVVGDRDAPLFVFVHGGYWRAGSAADFSFVARGLNAIGLAVAVVDYSLCPVVTVDEITRQVRAAIAWLYHNAQDCQFDPKRIYAGGHSAGGQQVAMLLETDWDGVYGLSANLLRGVVAISGVYDLRPLRFSYLQPMINLSHQTIAEQSPLLNPLRQCDSRLLVTVGALESEEFQRQSHEYTGMCSRAGRAVELWLQSDTHHFNAIAGFNDGASDLCRKVSELVAADLPR